MRGEIYFHSCDIRRQALCCSRRQSQQEAGISTRDSPFPPPPLLSPFHSPGVESQKERSHLLFVPVSDATAGFYYGQSLGPLSPRQPSSKSQLKRQINNRNTGKGASSTWPHWEGGQRDPGTAPSPAQDTSGSWHEGYVERTAKRPKREITVPGNWLEGRSRPTEQCSRPFQRRDL